MLPPESQHVLVAAASTPDPLQDHTKEAVSSVETLDECFVLEICVDQYLWSVYQRAPKVDTIKVRDHIRVTVKKKRKRGLSSKLLQSSSTRTLRGRIRRRHKKPACRWWNTWLEAMDRSFKLTLYHALRALDDAGLSPGITSGFRDDYRQSLASGTKAATESSYHGGSRRGGYGHGLAADLVSVKGKTRSERWSSSKNLWKWIDAHGKEIGIGRPYLDKDPPHVAPIDGKEYADHRGGANAQLVRD
jgi:hypothetical protein